jgi:hypothetical protein
MLLERKVAGCCEDRKVERSKGEVGRGYLLDSDDKVAILLMSRVDTKLNTPLPSTFRGLAFA